ncbi:hypothetical protein K439DRAFT_1655872 [Ramaria rubella]|nr:hypothetical protein K439DRAFT_1655872 [Ramaria rubella]
MQRRSPFNSPPSSLPSSPLVSAVNHASLPLPTPLNVGDGHTPQRRLLVPTVRQTRLTSPRFHRSRTGKMTRQSRSGSLGAELGPNRENKDWVSMLGRMHIVEDQVELRGYRIYAVEKWVVERGRLVNTVSVYTGDPRHKAGIPIFIWITVTVLAPFFSLSDTQAQTEFDNAVHLLRRDGARPRETDQGVILVTSLSNFRSDYNLVLIPGGNFLAAREQLYVNINLLRMGCSGRSVLTLEEPSEPTKDRYLFMYCFSEAARLGNSFNHSVLELVKLVQCALAFFGMFDVSPEEKNGLLCDVTAEGISRWTDTVGEPLLSLEPMERVGDPSVVSALLSVVVTMRNKLHALGCTQVPKDPFQDPMGFMHTVSALHSHKVTSPFVAASSGCLSLDGVMCINEAYERTKSRGTEYRVPRLILSKIDDITTDLNLRGSMEPSFNGHIYPTADLTGFVHMILGTGSKDSIESLKALWTGKLPRRKKSKKDGGEEEERERTDGKSTEDEDSLQSIFPSWGKHMKSFDFGLGRSKKPSIDLAAKLQTHKSFSADEAPANLTPHVLPSLVISGESGGEGSPWSTYPSSIGKSPATSVRSSNVNLVSPESLYPLPRLPIFPSRLPSRLSTASDPLTSSQEERRAFLRRTSTYDQRTKRGDDDDELEMERRANRGLLLGATHRRHSVDDLSKLRDRPSVPLDRMKIDVGLCGQYLIMRRREHHLQNMTALLEHLNASLTLKNARVQDDLNTSEEPLAEVTRLRNTVWTAIDAIEARFVRWGSVQEVMRYQADQMDTKHLCREARQQRSRIAAVRQAVFDAPPGTRPKPGTASRRFFRVQATLDPEDQRLVDWLGRTESEAEEEGGMPEEGEGMWLPPFEDLLAYTIATKQEKQSGRRWRWWWPFAWGADKGNDEETTPTPSTTAAPGEERP